MTQAPKESPTEAAPRIVGMFLAEWIPGVQKEFELLVMAGEGPLKISLFDLQMETLIFGLHCLDRAIFAQFGDEYRTVFMDQAFGFACDAFSSALPANLGADFVERFDKHCRERHKEYGAMKLLPAEGAGPNGGLCWEFAKRICLLAGVEEPLAFKVMLENAYAILGMMMKVAQTLQPGS
jgi:hypothetical protein